MNSSNKISKNDLKKCMSIISKLRKYYYDRIVGQEYLFNSLLVCIMANGHILLESVPGLAKTTSAKVITNAFDGIFSRVQCTPDLLPSDIIGTQVFNYSNNDFDTRIGPINCNLFLLDEINRSSSKTQSATLEAMQERQISIGDKCFKLPDVFVVIATQNPIEHEGTYTLSEAQLDRFLMKEVISYPSIDEEVEILNRIENNTIMNNKSIIELKDLEFLQSITNKVYIDNSIKQYISQIIYATRYPHKYIDSDLANYIDLGSSTRGAIAFMNCSKAVALINGRDYVIPDDIKDLRYSVLRHRITLNYSAIADNISVESIIDEIFGKISTP